MADPGPTEAGAAPRSQARVLASGSLAQQLAQVTGLLAMFAIITVLARRLSLTEFGVYGLLTSLAGYLLVVQNSAASAAVRAMAAASDDAERRAAFSSSASVYAAAGLITGVAIAAVGFVLASAVDMSSELEQEARLGSLLLGAVTAVGWPITVYRDALRASQLFVRAAMIEMLALVVYALLVLALAFADVRLAVLIAASGTIPMLAGLGCAISARLSRLPFHFSPRSVTSAKLRELAALAFYVSLTEAAGTIVYALDRIVLGVFKSAATVGLYEGPVRAHNVVRALNAATTVTVVPSASRYAAEGDTRRMRELLLRGIRYTLGLAVPLTVTGMVLAAPMLDVWLGPEFRQAGTAMAILMSYWLVNGCSGVLAGIIVACGRARTLAGYAWVTALSNLVLSVALTPPLGLEGVVIGTAVPYFVAFPFVLGIVLSEVPVAVATLVRGSFLPPYVLGLGLALALAAARLAFEPDTVASVLACAVTGVVGYWIAFYTLVLKSDERRLVREIVAGALPSGRARAQIS